MSIIYDDKIVEALKNAEKDANDKIIDEINKIIFESPEDNCLNKEMINKVDNIVKNIITVKKSKYRDNFFPGLINALDLKTGVEIGVDTAEFSCHILTKTKMTQYYCVDTWMDNFGSGIKMKKSTFNKDGNMRFIEASERLDEFGDRAVFLKMSSLEAANKFNDNSLDFLYIDGDHSLAMLLDLYAWIPKIRIGGICSGHDYKIGKNSGIRDYNDEQLDYEVKTCVDYFCKRYGYKLRTVGGVTLSWWFVKNKEI